MDSQAIGNDAALPSKFSITTLRATIPPRAMGSTALVIDSLTPFIGNIHLPISRIDWNARFQSAGTRFSGEAICRMTANQRRPRFPVSSRRATVLTNNKGFAAGYTFVISANLVNDLRYGLTREGVATSGAANRP